MLYFTTKIAQCKNTGLTQKGMIRDRCPNFLAIFFALSGHNIIRQTISNSKATKTLDAFFSLVLQYFWKGIYSCLNVKRLSFEMMVYFDNNVTGELMILLHSSSVKVQYFGFSIYICQGIIYSILIRYTTVCQLWIIFCHFLECHYDEFVSSDHISQL